MTAAHISVVHAAHGSPIEILVWTDGGEVRREIISDRRALQMAADLVAAVLSNEGARNAH